MSRRFGIASDLREKIVNKRKACENLSISSRRSSCSYETPLKLHDIPKTTSELLKRYGNTRMKIPSYKQDAATLVTLVILKPLKRIFSDLNLKIKSIGKVRNPYEKNSNLLIQNSSIPGQKNRNFSHFYCGKSSVLVGFSQLFKSFCKAREQKLFFGLRCIESVYKKKVAVGRIGWVVMGVRIRTKKETLKSIMKADLNKDFSVLRGKVLPIPPLNLERQYFSPYFPQNLRRSGVLCDHSMNSSKRSNLMTDRRSEKHQNPSTLPSSIYSDSENSVTERSEVKNTSKKKLQTIKLQNIDSFFTFDSVHDCKKPASKKSFFSDQERNSKNSSKSLKTFSDNYELFAFDKIIKQYTEKILVKGFYKWKFGVKKRRNSSRSISVPPKCLKSILALRYRKSLFSGFSALNSNFHRFKLLKKTCQHFSKDVKYRLSICFNHWITKSTEHYLLELKVLSLIQNLSYSIQMRKSWVISTFKIINKKSYI